MSCIIQILQHVSEGREMKQSFLSTITNGSCWPLRNLNFASSSPTWSSVVSGGAESALDTNILESAFIDRKQIISKLFR